MRIRNIAALCISFVILACGATPGITDEFNRPTYIGRTSPIVQPITIKIKPLNAKASMIGETITRTTVNSKSQQVQSTMSGTVESYRFGNRIQVSYICNNMNVNGVALQNALPVVMKLELDEGGVVSDFQVAGKYFDRIEPAMRESLQTSLKSLSKFLTLGSSARPLSHGDVAYSIRVLDAFMMAITSKPVSDASKGANSVRIEGPGIVGRLAGRTLYENRQSYLIVWDGNETAKDSTTSISVVAAGYSVIDAATGLFSENHILANYSGYLNGRGVEWKELTHGKIQFP